MTDHEHELPIIGVSYPSVSSVFLYSFGRRDLSLLAPAITKALEDAGLSVRVDDGSLTISGRHEARTSEFRMDSNIWSELRGRGFSLNRVIPISVRNVFSGGQHGAGKPRIYMYEGLTDASNVIEPVFVTKGEGSHVLLESVRNFANAHPNDSPDFDHIVAHLNTPAYSSHIWAPLMRDTRDIVGLAVFTNQEFRTEVLYIADSMVALLVGAHGFEYLTIPNSDTKPRFVATWKQLIRG